MDLTLPEELRSFLDELDAFIEALDYSDEEKAGGLYSFDAVEEVDSVSGWLGEPTETVQMTNSGCNG